MTIRTYQYQIQALTTASSGSVISRNVTHADILSQDVEGAINAEYTGVTDTVQLVDFAVYDVLLGNINNIVSELGLEQDTNVFGWVYPSNELSLTQTVEGAFPIDHAVKNDLFIAQAVNVRHFVRNITLEDELSLESHAKRVKEFTVESVLNFDQYGDFTFIEQDLNLVSTATWGYGFDIEQDLGLAQAVDKDQLIGRVVEHTNVVEQSAAWYIENRCNRFKFKTFHGEGGVAPKPLGTRYANTFLLYSQLDGEILELRNPETDDRRRYSFNRVNRSFFDGTLDLYTDANSITETREIYTIVANKREKLDALQAFMQNNLGLPVWLKDWRGVTWDVIILNPGEVYTEDAEGYWTLDFEVIGEPYDGEPVFQGIDLVSTPSRAGSIYLRSGTGTLALVDQANVEYNIDVPSEDVSLSGAASFTIVTP